MDHSGPRLERSSAEIFGGDLSATPYVAAAPLRRLRRPRLLQRQTPGRTIQARNPDRFPAIERPAALRYTTAQVAYHRARSLISRSAFRRQPSAFANSSAFRFPAAVR